MDSSAIRGEWLQETISTCQALIGHSIHPRSESLDEVLSDFARHLRRPHSKVEALILHGILTSLSLRWGDADHRSFHRVLAPDTACSFHPGDIAATVWRSEGSDPERAFGTWRREYARQFLRAHPLYCAMELRHTIDEHFEKQRNVVEFAHRCDIAPQRLQKEFQALTGTSALEYQTARRVAEAVKMLQTSDATVDTIARLVGWSSRKDLNRALRTYAGATAVAIRDSDDPAGASS